MNKTKICCLNIEKEICDELSKTFEVYNGSLGKIVDVKEQNHRHNDTHLLLNYDFPENVHEYDIFISDVSNFEVIEYKNEDHQRNNIVGNQAYYFISEAPATLFNPIPYSCSLLKAKAWKDDKDHPIINIIFQYKKQSINYAIRDTADYKYNDNYYEETNYSHTEDFTGNPLYGKEVQICDNQIAKTLFESYTDEIEYYQTFIHPTKKDNNTGQRVPDKNFIPLLKNKHGQIISYIWFSEQEIAFMLPQLKSKKQLLDILFKEVLFQYFSDYFPEIETKTWTRNHQYYLPEQQRLEIEKQEATKKYQEEIERIDKELEAAANKYKFLHDILIETGDKLVKNVITYLKWLGFDNAIEKDKTATEGLLLEEDIQIDLGEKGLLIIEVKGINGTSKDSECSQISKIRHRRCKERNSFDVFALYIVNNERNIEPLKRTIPPFNDNQIKDAKYDERGLMYTWQLFNLYFNVENGFISKEEARDRFLQTGLIDFTPTLKELGKPYKFYQNHTVICVELQNNSIHVGDTLAYEKDGRYFPITIVEIQQDEKPIDEVSDGKVGIKVDEKVPEIKMLYRI